MKACPVALLAVVLIAFAAGCATFTPYDDLPSAASSDPQLASDIQNRLADDSITSRYTFGVSVLDGIATVQGGVPSETVRARTLGIVRGTTGVRGVEDRLERW